MTPTSGGNAAGRVATMRSARRPGNSNRVSRKASGTPMISEAKTDATEMMSVLFSASRSAGLARNSRQCCRPPSKLPNITAALGYTTDQSSSARTGMARSHVPAVGRLILVSAHRHWVAARSHTDTVVDVSAVVTARDFDYDVRGQLHAVHDRRPGEAPREHHPGPCIGRVRRGQL